MEAFEENLFYQLAFVCSESRQTFVQHIGLSQPRHQLLTYLAQKGETSHAVLQQHLALDGATVTRLVKQFEAEGLVSRRLDPQDNRYTLASLTDSGRQTVAGISAAHNTFQSRVLEGITREEQEIMERVLKRLRTNMRLIQNEGREHE